MVEMRWVKRTVRSAQSEMYNQEIKVLQYRYRSIIHGKFVIEPSLMTSGIENSVNREIVNAALGDWSEWIDVPTVKEE